MAEKKVIELEVKSNLGSLKSQLREAQNDVNALSEKFGATSQEAINAAKRAAQLKDAIGDAKALTDAFNPDAKFNALSSSIGGVLNGFQAFEGALGLVGVEGEAVQETLLKVQSAMALSQGIQGLAEARDSFKQLGAVIGDTFKGLKGALLASGIGAFVVLLGVVASEWDNIAESLGLVNKKQEAYNDTLEDYKKGATEAIVSTQKVKSAFDLAKEGVISKEEALQTYNDTLGDSFGKATSLAQAEELYNSKADAYVQAMAKRARATAFFQKSAELATEAITSSQEDQTSFFDKVGVAFQSFGKSYEQTNKELLVIQQKRAKENAKKKNEEAKFFEELAILETKSAETLENSVGIKSEAEIKLENDRKQRAEAQKQRRAEEKRAQEEELKRLAQIEKERLDNIRDLENEFRAELEANSEEYNTNQLSKQEQELQAVNDKYFNLIEKAKQYNIDTTELEEQRLNELNNVNLTYAQQELLLNEETQKALDEQNQATADKELERQKQLQEAKINLTKQGLTLISDLADLFAKKDEASQRKAFKIKKAVSMATALIDTYQGASSAFAQTPGGIGIKTIAAGIATGSGLARFAAIAKTKFEGGSANAPSGGGSGFDGGGGSTVNAPNFNVVGNNGQNQLAQLSQQPIQAYVVSGEVTSAQALDRNRVQNATL